MSRTSEPRIFISDARGRKIGERGFEHGVAGLSEMAVNIVKPTGAELGAISIAIEVPYGLVVENLMQRGFRGLPPTSTIPVDRS